MSLAPPSPGTDLRSFVSMTSPRQSLHSSCPISDDGENVNSVILNGNSVEKPSHDEVNRPTSTSLKQSECVGAHERHDTSDIPECWTVDQANYFKSENPWLIIANKKLGCQTCKSVKSISVLGSQGIRLSAEWRECKIAPFGKTRSQQQTALRKKNK